jgi:hypothetical protein
MNASPTRLDNVNVSAGRGLIVNRSSVTRKFQIVGQTENSLSTRTINAFANATRDGAMEV